jgi:hypothetical protein
MLFKFFNDIHHHNNINIFMVSMWSHHVSSDTNIGEVLGTRNATNKYVVG